MPIAKTLPRRLSSAQRQALRSEAIAFVHELIERERAIADFLDSRFSAQDLLEELSDRFEPQGGRPALSQAFPAGPITEIIRALGLDQPSSSRRRESFLPHH